MEQRRVLEAGLSEDAVVGSGDERKEKSANAQRFSAKRKSEVVLRLLRGEDLELLSRELGVSAARISRWQERFVVAGETAMKKRVSDERDEGLMRLQAKLGEITMENELLREKIGRLEVGGPLGRRRSRR